jgi:hypothetical protein
VTKSLTRQNPDPVIPVRRFVDAAAGDLPSCVKQTSIRPLAIPLEEMPTVVALSLSSVSAAMRAVFARLGARRAMLLASATRGGTSNRKRDTV